MGSMGIRPMDQQRLASKHAMKGMTAWKTAVCMKGCGEKARIYRGMN